MPIEVEYFTSEIYQHILHTDKLPYEGASLNDTIAVIYNFGNENGFVVYGYNKQLAGNIYALTEEGSLHISDLLSFKNKKRFYN